MKSCIKIRQLMMAAAIVAVALGLRHLLAGSSKGGVYCGLRTLAPSLRVAAIGAFSDDRDHHRSERHRLGGLTVGGLSGPVARRPMPGAATTSRVPTIRRPVRLRPIT